MVFDSSTLRLAFPLALLLAVGPGCGDSTSDAITGGNGGQGTGDGGGGNPSEGGGGAEPIECELPEANPGVSNDIPVETVTISARDEAGAAITDQDLQFCGVDGCLYATTNLLGSAAFSNNLSSDTIDRPLVKPPNAVLWGKIGYPWDPTAENPLPVVFPAMEDSGQFLVPGTTVSAAGVEVTLDPGTIVNVDELVHDQEEERTFRAAQVPTPLVAQVTGDATFSMVFALGPIDTLFCGTTGAAVTFENYADLPADAAVEIFGQELATGEVFGPYGEWSKIADGTVSSDGTTITTSGDGLPVFLTVAIKQAL